MGKKEKRSESRKFPIKEKIRRKIKNLFKPSISTARRERPAALQTLEILSEKSPKTGPSEISSTEKRAKIRSEVRALKTTARATAIRRKSKETLMVNPTTTSPQPQNSKFFKD